VKGSTRSTSGARLPLMLLLGFLVLVAGVAVWLTLSSPPPVDKADAPAENASAAADHKEAEEKAPAPHAVLHGSEAAPDAATGTRPGATATGEIPGHGGATEQPPSPPHTDDTHSPADVGEPSDVATTPPGSESATPSPTPPPTLPENAPEPASKSADTPAKSQPSAPSDTSVAVVPKKLPRVAPDAPLAPSPDPALVQMTSLGPLPRVGEDGRLPRRVYAKPFNTTDRRPRVAIVVTGLGLSAAATESAIQGLSGGVTLAFAPYSPRLNEWIRLARAAGHEVLINVPMEPTNYPAYDPGPQTLLTTLNAQGNLDRLFWSLSRGTGYVGVLDFFGSQFTTSQDHMTPVLNAIKQRGLLYLDSNSSPRSVSSTVAARRNLVSPKATLTLDERASRTEIDRRFAELEQRAKREGRAIGIASPYPVSLERIANWVRQLEARGIAIAPVSALTQTPSPSQASQ
jgi:uncharacterized protein